MNYILLILVLISISKWIKADNEYWEAKIVMLLLLSTGFFSICVDIWRAT